MGNVNIALPTDDAVVTADSTDGIRVVPTPQGSRSVLGMENEIGSSLFSLTVLPAYGKTIQDPIANRSVPIANKASKRAYKMPSKQVECKRTLSWADIVKR